MSSLPRVVLALGVPLQLGAIEVHVAQIARRVALRLIVEVRRRRIAALAAGGDRPRAHASDRTRRRRRSCCRSCRTTSSCPDTRARRTTRASPSVADVKPTGMLGPASLNGCTMSSVRRWKRLMSPHGVFQVPKSAVSLSDAATSACSSLRRAGAVSRSTPPRAAAAAALHLLAPEDRERRRHRRRATSAGPTRAAARSARRASPSADRPAGAASHALRSAGIGFSNHVR